MAKYKIADVLFEFFAKYKYSEKLLENYLYHGEETPQLKIDISAEDIKFEDKGGHGFPEYYSECLAVYRKLSNYILENVKSGNIILMHDYHSGGCTTTDALRMFIPNLIEQGYRFVTVSELIAS